MNVYTVTCPTTGEVWQRVHANKARSLFAKGVELRGIPCKQVLFGVWSNGGFSLLIDKESTDTSDFQFHVRERAIWAYNCCSQLGYSVAFYVQTKDLEVPKVRKERRPKYNKAFLYHKKQPN